MNNPQKDQSLQRYLSTFHIYNVFEALLSGLCVMVPEPPEPWIAEKLRSLYDIGFMDLNWDTFIDPSMRPVHPLVNQEVFQALFCFGKFGHAEAVDAQDQPTAEMLAIAYQTYKQNALKKYFKAWQLFLIIAETRRAYKHNLNLVACDHWRLQKQLTIFLRWRDWTRWAVNRKELASTLLRNVLNQLTAKMALYFWKLVAMRARQIRELNSGLIGDNVHPKDDATMDEDVSDYEFGKTEAFHVTEKHKDPIKSLPNFIQRKICAYFTGNLDAPVACSPSFPGTEANYLRAQIARISASTQISPEGFFTSEHGEEEEEPEPEQLEDEEGGGQITINEDYEPLPMTQLASPKVEHWVHHVPYILPQGRVTWWNPSSSDFDETEQIPEEEEEEEEEGAGKAHPSLPESGLPILSRVSLDAPIFGQPAWSVKMSPIFVPENAVVLVSSNLWPGSHAVAWERKFENIYIGWGSKTTGTAFQPYLPPDVMSEYQDTPEVIEIIDPTPEDEAALRKVQNAEEERGGTDEEGVQSEGESDATREEA
ncbi:unnamed protein product [Dicrocoelium dendriticum]|nr:unnamed protein product [Dicrocoelium dendriticum]